MLNAKKEISFETKLKHFNFWSEQRPAKQRSIASVEKKGKKKREELEFTSLYEGLHPIQTILGAPIDMELRAGGYSS